MSTIKISTSLTAARVAEARERVGARGLSRYLDDALARQLQFDRLGDLEQELEKTFGPIPDDAQRTIDEMEWPD